MEETLREVFQEELRVFPFSLISLTLEMPENVLSISTWHQADHVGSEEKYKYRISKSKYTSNLSNAEESECSFLNIAFLFSL